jgi:hypothetical protein
VFPYAKTLKMGSTAGDGIARGPTSASRSRCRNRISAAFYPAVAFSEFRKLTYRLANMPRGVTLSESHLSEVTGLGGAATESILSVMLELLIDIIPSTTGNSIFGMQLVPHQMANFAIISGTNTAPTTIE